MSGVPNWIKELPSCGKPFPILTYPALRFTPYSVYDVTHSAEAQANLICEVATRFDMAAAVTVMDLSVEAEAFGAAVVADSDNVPAVVGSLFTDPEDISRLEIPSVGSARTGIFVEAAKAAKCRIKDRPVLAGVIGPFSLAGRLNGISEVMMNCITDLDFVHSVLDSVTGFLIDYAKAYKSAGLDGIILAEPLSGLLSPTMEEEFSCTYVRRMVDALQDEDFGIVYHNCGENTPLMTESIAKNGCAACHFGDAVDMVTLLERMPSDRPICGNISPVSAFVSGTPEKVRAMTEELVAKCSGFDNFVLSSGCDIPPTAKWENIEAFFSMKTRSS